MANLTPERKQQLTSMFTQMMSKKARTNSGISSESVDTVNKFGSPDVVKKVQDVEKNAQAINVGNLQQDSRSEAEKTWENMTPAVKENFELIPTMDKGVLTMGIREKPDVVTGRTQKAKVEEETRKRETEKEQAPGVRQKGFEDEQLKSLQEARGASRVGTLASMNNLENLTGVGRDFMDVYAKGVDEGGLGGFVQSKRTALTAALGEPPKALRDMGLKKFPGALDPEASFSESFSGKRQEFLLKMMPMLTQQAMKSTGSMRIIRGVMQALGQTIPDEQTRPQAAKQQVTQSIRTFFRFARAAENLGMSIDEILIDSETGLIRKEIKSNEITDWVEKVNELTGKIELSADEQDALDNMTGATTKPVTDLLQRREGTEKRMVGDIDFTKEIEDGTPDIFKGMTTEEIQAIAQGR